MDELTELEFQLKELEARNNEITGNSTQARTLRLQNKIKIKFYKKEILKAQNAIYEPPKVLSTGKPKKSYF